MSGQFETLRCPNCGKGHQIEMRENQVFCSETCCGFYFNRQRKKVEYDPNNSSRPLWDSLGRLLNSSAEPVEVLKGEKE